MHAQCTAKIECGFVDDTWLHAPVALSARRDHRNASVV